MRGLVVEATFRRLTVPFSRHAAGAARSALRSGLSGAGVAQPVIDDAQVVVSELVTNAVRHASPRPDGQVDVEWAVDSDRLWLRVIDGGLGTGLRHGGLRDGFGGRGLSIVAALSDAWDFEPRPEGTTVTAVLVLG